MKIREHKNIILTALTLIPMLVSTFFTFYRNAELYIDLQWKVIEALGNPALIVFMIFVILLFAAQALKIIFKNKSFTNFISQKALFWLSVLEALFVGYMFLNNAGLDKVQVIYSRLVIIILSSLVLLFWYPKSKIKNNIPIKIAAIIIALVIALIPWCNQIQKKRGCLLCP